jgi:hypothetical protein
MQLALTEGIIALCSTAAARDNYELCQLLLANGANVDARMRNGRTPLHYAGTSVLSREHLRALSCPLYLLQESHLHVCS